MKDKILEIINEYKTELLKYVKFWKKKTKKYLKKLKILFKDFKTSLLRSENRKRYLTISGMLIVVNLLLIGIYVSYGYYYNESGISLINAKVGNPYLNYDYVLMVYLEDPDNTGNGNGSYRLASEIPTLGYTYSGYKCLYDSTLIYDEETKTTSVTTEQKEVCSLYFDIIGSMDLTIKIMLEDSIGSNNYVLSNIIPSFGYKYNYFECDNNSELEYNEELHTVKLSSDTEEHCSIYFTKEEIDVSINLYVEEDYQTGDYIKRLTIPSNIEYVLNDNNSFCVNNNNERVDNNITYENGYIEMETSEITSCDVYLDRKND